jgi:hypothetical protein
MIDAKGMFKPIVRAINVSLGLAGAAVVAESNCVSRNAFEIPSVSVDVVIVDRKIVAIQKQDEWLTEKVIAGVMII